MWKTQWDISSSNTSTGTQRKEKDSHLKQSKIYPDILECEVKWALGSNTMNKTSKGDEIPVELFQILEDDAVKVLYSIC